MTDIAELLRSKGKVSAPDGFTSRILKKIDTIVKTRECIEFLFSVWAKLTIIIFKTIENVFAPKTDQESK